MKKIVLFAISILTCHFISAQAIKVQIQRSDSGWQLTRDGKPYFIKGAGGSGYLSRVAAYGGNSIRTWGTKDAARILDSAKKNGLTVLMGLDVARERHGFNYNDSAAIRKQFEQIRGEVERYKDHPSLLAWGIGNELNLGYSNPAVWNAVNDIAKMIHSIDPNHPVTTVLAGVHKDLVDHLKTRTPDIDFLAVNTYAGLSTLPKEIREAGWDGAYMVTEWGPTGHWEGLSTSWHSPIEETSSEKAAVYRARYEYGVEQDRKHCMGSYVFLWGQKQERTPTWYGLFTNKGEESEVVDVMQFLWSGSWPANKAPHLYSLQLDGKTAVQSAYVQAGASYAVLVVASDPDNDKLNYRYEILPEPKKVGDGGDFEEKPQAINGLITTTVADGKVRLKAPAEAGAYRLFVYVTDGHNNVATANLPFWVRK